MRSEGAQAPRQHAASGLPSSDRSPLADPVASAGCQAGSEPAPKAASSGRTLRQLLELWLDPKGPKAAALTRALRRSFGYSESYKEGQEQPEEVVGFIAVSVGLAELVHEAIAHCASMVTEVRDD